MISLWIIKQGWEEKINNEPSTRLFVRASTSKTFHNLDFEILTIQNQIFSDFVFQDFKIRDFCNNSISAINTCFSYRERKTLVNYLWHLYSSSFLIF